MAVTRSRRSRLTLAAGVLALVVAAVLLVTTGRASVAGWQMVRADECVAGADCLRAESGELSFDGHGRGSEYWYFTRSVGGVGERLSFSSAEARALHEGPGRSLRWDGEVVAVEVDGRRAETGSWGFTPVSAYAAFALLSAGVGLLLVRRSGGPARLGAVAWPLVAAGVGMLFGAIGGSVAAGLVLAVPLAAVAWLLRRQAATAAGDPRQAGRSSASTIR